MHHGCYSTLAEMEAEARNMERVRGHVNVVQFVDAWSNSEYYNIQMELAGETLERFLHRESPLVEPAALALFTDILEVPFSPYPLRPSFIPFSPLLCTSSLPFSSFILFPIFLPHKTAAPLPPHYVYPYIHTIMYINVVHMYVVIPIAGHAFHPHAWPGAL